MKKGHFPVLQAIALSLVAFAPPSIAQAPTYVPKAGFLPDAKTAIAVATVVLVPIYGEKQINAERPFTATLDKGIWTVNGTLPEGMAGGTASLRLDKKDGHIYSVIHGK